MFEKFNQPEYQLSPESSQALESLGVEEEVRKALKRDIADDKDYKNILRYTFINPLRRGNPREFREVVLNFCDKIGEPYPKTPEDNARLLEKLDSPEFQGKLTELKMEDIHPLDRELNELVKITKEGRNNVLLHIAKIDVPTRERPAMFKDGLEKLARLLESDRHFSDVKFIGASSWIVAEHPRVLEHFGFTVDYENQNPDSKKFTAKYKGAIKTFRGARDTIPEEYRETKPKYAQISKEEFLSRYGSRESHEKIAA